MKYWVNYKLDTCAITNEGKELFAPWKEVSKEEYERMYSRAWDNAMNGGIWHC